jgi:ribosome-associated translation inhibitor RaiA
LRIGKNHHRTQKRKKVVTVIGEKTKTVIAQKKDFDVYRAFDFAIHQFMEAVRKIQLGEGLQRVVKKRPKKIMLAS